MVLKVVIVSFVAILAIIFVGYPGLFGKLNSISAKDKPKLKAQLTNDSEYVVERRSMVNDQIKARGVKSPEVLRAMETVCRHEFVPEKLQRYSYYDEPLPIGYGQTISQPYIVAYMAELLELDKDDVVLEIGTGSGYQAAILSVLTKQVYTIEIINKLGLMARDRLQELGYDNVEVKIGDGYHGWPDHAPYDAVIVTAAPKHVPPELINQLKNGGKMVIPTGDINYGQILKLIKKGLDGKIVIEDVLPVRFVPLTRE